MWQMDLVKATSKVVALSRSGRLAMAKQLFDEMTERDLVLWNAMISGYSNVGCCVQALNLMFRMRVSGIQPDEYTLTATLSVAASAAEFWQGAKLHGLVICSGYQSHLPVSNSLLDMYGKCMRPADATTLFDEMGSRNVISWCSLLLAYAKSGCWDLAHRVFDRMPGRNLVAWNVMIAEYSKRGEVEASLAIFKKMLQLAEVEGDCWTFSSLVNACSYLPGSCCGKMVHAYVIKAGRSSPTEVGNSVLSFYAEFGCHEDAIKIFESIEFPNQVSWNAIINAYMKAGDVCKALSLFADASERNSISWTAMVSGFARNGHGELALSFFVEMLRSHMRPDDFTFGAVFFACSTLALLGHGRTIHGGVVRCGFVSYAYVANGLINMYAKCGDLEASKRAFDENLRRDLVSWNGMIMGFAQHGRAADALCLFEGMLSSGMKPDKVTFLGLLMACSHAGLVEKGWSLLELMERDHGVVCEEDQVACMVDLLGRNGQFSEAQQLVNDHSSKPGQSSLLGACSMHMDRTLLGKQTSKDLFPMEPRNEVDYVLLSNLYCSAGQWKEAERVRMDMAGRGVKKKPGCSWIQVLNTVVVFVAGDLSHVWTADVHKTLTFLERQMRNPSLSHFDHTLF